MIIGELPMYEKLGKMRETEREKEVTFHLHSSDPESKINLGDINVWQGRQRDRRQPPGTGRRVEKEGELCPGGDTDRSLLTVKDFFFAARRR